MQNGAETSASFNQELEVRSEKFRVAYAPIVYVGRSLTLKINRNAIP